MLTVDSDGSIHLTRGDTARFSVSINNLVSNSNYVVGEDDLLVLTVKKSIKDDTPCIQKRMLGSNQFHIESTDTQELAFGSYIYDVQLTTATGDVYTVIPPSTFEILKEVTY